ncbi:MAG: molybdopterin-dependent oxidoreductase, partial [Actinobacteria bacterium]|nr:molybdopterin-dependent oxidoreductase [Actinomycetota bacterium]
RVKHAIVEDGARLIELTPQRTGLSRYAAATLAYRPGEAAAAVSALLGDGSGDAAGLDANALDAARAVLGATEGPVTVLLGRANLAESAATIVDAAALLNDRLAGVKFLSTLRRANVHGALDMGMAPGLLPGRVRRSDAAAWFGEAWSTVPESDGLDAAGILQAAADGKIDTLVLLGADPLADFPDRQLAERALTGARAVIALDLFLNESSKRADVVLAASAAHESGGTHTNLEGRVSLVAQKVTPVGTTRADWAIAVELADRLGHDLGLESVEEIWAEIEDLSGIHNGLTLEALRANSTEGLLAPQPLPELEASAPDAGEDDEGGEDGEGAAEATAEGADGTAVEGDAAEDAESDEATVDNDGPELVEAPEALVFVAPEATSVPPLDAYSLRVISTRRMYDNGTMLAHARSSANLAEAAVMRLHPQDIATIGLAEGGRVKITSNSRSLVLDAVADPTVARGTATLADGAPNVSVHELIEANAPITEIRLEAAR